MKLYKKYIILPAVLLLIVGSAEASGICSALFKKTVPKLSIYYPDDTLNLRVMDTSNYTYEGLLKLKNGTPEQRVEFIRIMDDFLAQDKASELSEANNLFMEVSGSTRTIPDIALTTPLYRSIKNDANFSEILKAMPEIQSWEKDPNTPAIVRKAIVLSKFSQINMQKKYSSDSLYSGSGLVEGATRNSFEYTTVSEVHSTLSLLSRKDRLKLIKSIFSKPENILAIKSSIKTPEEGLQLHKILSSSPETFLAGIQAKVIELSRGYLQSMSGGAITPKFTSLEGEIEVSQMYNGIEKKAAQYILNNKLNIEDYRSKSRYEEVDTFYDTIIHYLVAKNEYELIEKVVRMTLERNKVRDQRLLENNRVESTSMHYFRRAIQRSFLDLYLALNSLPSENLAPHSNIRYQPLNPYHQHVVNRHVLFLQALYKAGVSFSDLPILLLEKQMAFHLPIIGNTISKGPIRETSMRSFAAFYGITDITRFLIQNNIQ